MDQFAGNADIQAVEAHLNCIGIGKKLTGQKTAKGIPLPEDIRRQGHTSPSCRHVHTKGTKVSKGKVGPAQTGQHTAQNYR